jgi:hypothetical protein
VASRRCLSCLASDPLRRRPATRSPDLIPTCAIHHATRRYPLARFVVNLAPGGLFANCELLLISIDSRLQMQRFSESTSSKKDPWSDEGGRCSHLLYRYVGTAPDPAGRMGRHLPRLSRAGHPGCAATTRQLGRPPRHRLFKPAPRGD